MQHRKHMTHNTHKHHRTINVTTHKTHITKKTTQHPRISQSVLWTDTNTHVKIPQHTQWHREPHNYSTHPQNNTKNKTTTHIKAHSQHTTQMAVHRIHTTHTIRHRIEAQRHTDNTPHITHIAQPITWKPLKHNHTHITITQEKHTQHTQTHTKPHAKQENTANNKLN